MKPSSRLATSFGCVMALVMVFTFPVVAQEQVEVHSVTEFHDNYDSLLKKIPSLPVSSDGIYVKYFYVWTSSYANERVERYGTMEFRGDSVREIFRMRPFMKGSLFEEPVKVNEWMEAVKTYALDKSVHQNLEQVKTMSGYYIQPTRVNTKFYYPLNAIGLMTVSSGSVELFGLSKHGRKELDSKQIEPNKDLSLFFEWLFDFERSPSRNH